MKYSEIDIKDAIFKAIHAMTYLYKAPPIQRIHADAETAGKSIEAQLMEMGIAVTRSQGHDPTAQAESAVGSITRQARTALAHFADRTTRRKLWG